MIAFSDKFYLALSPAPAILSGLGIGFLGAFRACRGLWLNILLLFFGIAIFCPASGRSIDSIGFTLPPAEVSASRIYAAVPFSDLLYTNKLSTDLHAKLLFESSANIRLQSISGLATVGLRGLPAGHTKVLWNGFAVQSPMNGVADIGIIPVSLFASAHVISGGHSGYYGSGALGGIIQLNHHGKPNSNQLGLEYRMGSFGKHYLQADAAIHHENNQQWLRVSALHRQQQGNFPFPDRTASGQPIRQMEHAASTMQAFLLSGSPVKLLNAPVELHAWVQQNKREIPASLTEGESLATQDDRALRFAANWRKIGTRSNHEIRMATFYDDLKYLNPKIQTDAFSSSLQYLTEYSNMYALSPNWLLKSAVLFEHTTSFADDYQKDRTRRKLNGFAAIQHSDRSDRWRIEAGVRLPWIDEKFTIFSPFLDGFFQISNRQSIHVNVSRNYRHPTLNDLYWVPNGNPELKSEHSRQVNIDHRISFRGDFGELTFTSSLFAIHLQDMIQWLSIQNMWQPVNQPEVLSSGAEQKVLFKKEITKRLALQYTGKMSYTRAEILTHPNDQIVGNQLTYTPYLKYNQSLSVGGELLRLSLQHVYTGKRFTTSDQSSSLPGFHLLSASLGGSLALTRQKLHWFVRCDNLMNTYYEWFPYQPMPGRSFEAGLNFNFQSL